MKDIICGTGNTCEATCPVMCAGRVCPTLIAFASEYVPRGGGVERLEVIAATAA
jgi:hypothetical protein